MSGLASTALLTGGADLTGSLSTAQGTTNLFTNAAENAAMQQEANNSAQETLLQETQAAIANNQNTEMEKWIGEAEIH